MIHLARHVYRMTSPFRLGTLFTEAWKTAATEPLLLVPGITLSLVTLFEESSLSALFDQATPQNILSLSANPIFFLITFLLITTTVKTLIQSQIFIIAAAKILNRPAWLTSTYRCWSALRYGFIELCFSIVLLIATLPISVLFFFKNNTWLIYITCFLLLPLIPILFLLKRIWFGYSLLSKLSLRSAFQLAWHLLLRYQPFNLFALMAISVWFLLFTFLENLVILQGAFLFQVYPGTSALGISYGASLLLTTFLSILFEVVWVHFFLLLTNKQRKEAPEISVILQKEVAEIPPTL